MNIKYRPEIDGLRAIAVVAVILYHAKITILGYKPFQGGFVGVDIFFVISGYLITSIILQELIITGTFSFKYFYERRIRRILPALLLVITVSLPFAWIYLLPTSFIDFSKSIIYSLGFGSNFYFHYSGQIYGADSGLLKPFLHTWSLSVEEQFYIIFPIILLIIFKYFRKYLGIILIIGFMTSLILADWTSRNYPSTSFYLLHTRMWELLAGSILGYFEMKLGHRASNRTLHLILPTLGLFFIALSIIFFNDKLFHPSFYTLSAVVGVCLIIWFSHKDEIVTKILSTKLFVGIGLISYSLYLWNYPIFAFARMSEFTLGDNFKKILLALLILLLSVISYYFVEKPARNKYRSFKIVSINIIFIVISLILVNSFIIKNNGFNNRLKYPEFYQEKATYNYLTSKSKICFNNIEICKFNNDKKKKIFLIGDSHFGSISYDLKNRIKKYQFIPITAAGYFYFEDNNILNIDARTKKVNKQFNDFNLKVTKELNNSKNNIIILGGSTSLYFFKERFMNKPVSWNFEFVNKADLEHSSEFLRINFYRKLEKLKKNNYVILIYPIPELGKDITKILRGSLNFTYTFDDYKKVNKDIIKYFDKINLDNLIKIKPADLLCNKVLNTCKILSDKGKLIYSDSWHTSLFGAQIINDLIIKEIRGIEAK